MEKVNIPRPEKRNVKIKVEYINIPPEDRVFEIDTEKIEEAVGIMFEKRRKNLTIEVRSGLSNEGGHYQNGKIVVWQDHLVQVARHWYDCAKADMGDDPDYYSYFMPEEKESTLKKIKDGIKFLPHKLAGLETPSLLTDEQQQASQMIIEMVRQTKDIQKGNDMTGELIRDAFKRSMAETLAHETGHAVSHLKIMISGLGIYLTGAALGILTAQGLYQNDAPAGVVMAAAAAAPILSFGGLIFGTPIIDEKMADQSQKKFFRLFIDAININSDVFERKVMAPISNV